MFALCSSLALIYALLLPQDPVQGPPPPLLGVLPSVQDATQAPLQGEQDPPTTTQDEDDPLGLRVYWDQGLRFETTDKRFRIGIGGRIHVDANFMTGTGELGNTFSTDPPGIIEDGTETRRARLYVNGDIYDEISYRIEYDFSTEEANAISVYMGFLHTPVGEVRAGFLKEPMSLERLTSSNDVTFMERALPVNLASFRSIGIQAIDSLENHRMSWSYGVFGESRAIAGDSIGTGEYAVTGRVTGLPIYEDEGETLLHLGLSGSYRNTSDDMFMVAQNPETHLAPDLLDSGVVMVEDGWIYGLETAAVMGAWSFQAEYLASSGDGVGTDPSLWGYYGYVSYFLTGEHRPYTTGEGRFTRVVPLENFSTKEDGGGGAWEVALRYSHLEFEDVFTPDEALSDWSVGLNWYLNANSRIMANFVQGELDSLSGAFRAFTIRFQAAF